MEFEEASTSPRRGRRINLTTARKRRPSRYRGVEAKSATNDDGDIKETSTNSRPDDHTATATEGEM